ncbi:MAG: TIGR00730 family Rossman fold protein [Spirochaetaceae bacterium]|nr:TIGR00730 family Rossman fold protein [Spirochaetaceae bacterium]
MNKMKSICVFCGSGSGGDPIFGNAARILGDLLAHYGLNLVYGGSNIGLMGLVSAAVRDGGGKVTGVIPRRIADKVPVQEGITMEVVPGMHERKARMYELSDAFIALPGGIGTLEETFEAWTWNQLGYHAKPVALLNINGYFDSLLSFLDRMSTEGFLRDSQRNALIVDADPEELLTKMTDWNPPKGLKWDKLKPSSGLG